MSRFLGPIHYWLYGKIGRQEELTRAFADTAAKHGWLVNASGYTKTLPALESVIDEGNIHGWLQSRIADAETRYAALVLAVLTEDEEHRLPRLQQAAFVFGRANALNTGISPEEAYKAFDSFFVNGMPCDRVNVVTGNDADALTWQETQDVHSGYWPERPELYTLLRQSVMEGMLAATAVGIRRPDESSYQLYRKTSSNG